MVFHSNVCLLWDVAGLFNPFSGGTFQNLFPGPFPDTRVHPVYENPEYNTEKVIEFIIFQISFLCGKMIYYCTILIVSSSRMTHDTS